MIVFELKMPHKASWNGKWSGDDKCYVRVKDQRDVPKDLWNQDFYYRWPDGWEACVSVKQMRASEARRLEKNSDGFCGYDWMIRSICNFGTILTEKEQMYTKPRGWD